MYNNPKWMYFRSCNLALEGNCNGIVDYTATGYRYNRKIMHACGIVLVNDDYIHLKEKETATGFMLHGGKERAAGNSSRYCAR
jgi:hypothetical protein